MRPLHNCLITGFIRLLFIACAPRVSRAQDNDYSLEDLVFEVVSEKSAESLDVTAYVTNTSSQIKVLEHGLPCASLVVRGYTNQSYSSESAVDILGLGTECSLPAFILEVQPNQKEFIFTENYRYSDMTSRKGLYYFTAQLKFSHWKEGRFSPLYTDELPLGAIQLD
jgi:hypothetical protein